MKFLLQCSVCSKQTTYDNIDSPFLLCQRLNSLLICPCSHHETPGGFLRYVDFWKRIDPNSQTKVFKSPGSPESHCLYKGIPFHSEFDPKSGEPLSLTSTGNLFGLLKPHYEDDILQILYPWED